MITRLSVTCALMIAVSLTSTANADFFQESFEADPGATYTLSNEFDDGFFDFFGRYMVPDNSNGARDDFQKGWDGVFGIIGQDHDGDGFDPTQTITMAGIDISGGTGLGVKIAFGALDSEPDFFNYEAADGDGIEIFATIDGGARTLIGRFAPNDSGASDLYRDTNLDGFGDGARLTVDLRGFTFLLPGTGSTLDLEIELTSTSSFEPLAVDNVRGIPEPATVSLLFFGTLAIVAQRRRRR